MTTGRTPLQKAADNCGVAVAQVEHAERDHGNDSGHRHADEPGGGPERARDLVADVARHLGGDGTRQRISKGKGVQKLLFARASDCTSTTSS